MSAAETKAVGLFLLLSFAFTAVLHVLSVGAPLFFGVSASLFATLCVSRQVRAVVSILIFLVSQTVFAFLMSLAVRVVTGEDAIVYADGPVQESAVSVVSLSLSSILSAVASVICYVRLGYVRLSEEFISDRRMWLLMPLCVLAVNGCLAALDILNEGLKLDNNLEQTFISMAASPVGMLSICLVAPVAEEILFRGVIIGAMRSKGVAPWLAVVVSSLLFGLVHANPAQISFAFMAGILFGVVYYATGSLVPSVLCHVVNNTLTVWAMNALKTGMDVNLASLVGAGDHSMAFAIALLTLCAALLYVYVVKVRTGRANRS